MDETNDQTTTKHAFLRKQKNGSQKYADLSSACERSVYCFAGQIVYCFAGMSLSMAQPPFLFLRWGEWGMGGGGQVGG